jgi:hypothetical protein
VDRAASRRLRVFLLLLAVTLAALCAAAVLG